MWELIGILGFLGAIVFLVISIISAFRKNGRAKRNILISGLCFTAFLIAIFSDDPDNPVSTEAVKQVNSAQASPTSDSPTLSKATTPEEIAKEAIHKAFGEKNKVDQGDSILEFSYIKDSGILFVKVLASDNLTESLIKKGMWMDTASVLKELKDKKEFKTIGLNIAFPLQDSYGNSSNDTVMKIQFSEETRNKINWENFLWNNIPKIADEYWEHPVIQKIKTD